MIYSFRACQKGKKEDGRKIERIEIRVFWSQKCQQSAGCFWTSENNQLDARVEGRYEDFQ